MRILAVVKLKLRTDTLQVINTGLYISKKDHKSKCLSRLLSHSLMYNDHLCVYMWMFLRVKLCNDRYNVAGVCKTVRSHFL